MNNQVNLIGYLSSLRYDHFGSIRPFVRQWFADFRLWVKGGKNSPLSPPNAICSFASKTYKHYLSYIMFSCNERPLARMCLSLLSCNGKTYMLLIICATQHLPYIVSQVVKQNHQHFPNLASAEMSSERPQNIFMLQWLWIRVLSLLLPCFVYDLRRYNSYKMNTGMSGNSCCLWKRRGC